MSAESNSSLSFQDTNLKLGKAVQVALNQVVGAYAIAGFDKKNPNSNKFWNLEF